MHTHILYHHIYEVDRQIDDPPAPDRSVTPLFHVKSVFTLTFVRLPGQSSGHDGMHARSGWRRGRRASCIMHIHVHARSVLFCWTRAHAAAWKIQSDRCISSCEAPQAATAIIRLTPPSDQAERSISLLSIPIVAVLHACTNRNPQPQALLRRIHAHDCTRRAAAAQTPVSPSGPQHGIASVNRRLPQTVDCSLQALSSSGRARWRQLDRSPSMFGRGAPCLLVDMARRSPRNACLHACVRARWDERCSLFVTRRLFLVACCLLPVARWCLRRKGRDVENDAVLDGRGYLSVDNHSHARGWQWGSRARASVIAQCGGGRPLTRSATSAEVIIARTYVFFLPLFLPSVLTAFFASSPFFFFSNAGGRWRYASMSADLEPASKRPFSSSSHQCAFRLSRMMVSFSLRAARTYACGVAILCAHLQARIQDEDGSHKARGQLSEV